MSNSNSSIERNVLSGVVTLSFIISVLGQLIFAIYVIVFYGKSWLSGHIQNWNIVLPNGYVQGDNIGNLVVGLHLLLAAIIIIGGPVQIVPEFRKHLPILHRWNGRIYISTAILLSISGLFMVWIRGSVGGITQHISISVNAILILISAAMVLKYAMMRNFIDHRIWAIRLFLFVNGVWYFRVGLFFWLFVNQGPVGFNPETLQGPFLTILSLSQYTLPLVLFELYQNAIKSSKKSLIWTSTVLIFLFTIVIGVGTFAASMSIWIPKMNY